MTFPAHQQSAEVLQPCEQALDLPSAFVASQFAAVLAVSSGAISTMRCDQLDPVLLGEKIVQRIAVIAPIGNQSFWFPGYEAVLDRSVDQFLLMRRSARNPQGDRKTMAVCDCHELAPFADERATNAIAPFLAPMKEASIKPSSRSNWPRAKRSSAKDHRTPSNTPERCHCWKRRWQVWYGPYRDGKSCHGAPVRSTHNTPFMTCRAWRHGRPRLSARRDWLNSTRGPIRSHCTSVRSAIPLICLKSCRDATVYSRATFMR